MTARERHVFKRLDNTLLCRPAGSPFTLALCHNPDDNVPWRVFFGGLANVGGDMAHHHMTRAGAVLEFKQTVAKLARA